MHVQKIIWRVFSETKRKMVVQKKKKTKESEGQEKWVQEEWDQENIREEMKKKEWKKNLMKEKHKNVFRKRFSAEKYGRGKERSKKENETVQHFLKKRKEKKKILPEWTKLCLCQNVRIIWKKKNIFKRG